MQLNVSYKFRVTDLRFTLTGGIIYLYF